MSQPAFDFDDLIDDDGGVPTYGVSELTQEINEALRRRFFDGVWVRGEIQGWRENGPHAYFQLVETMEDGKKAALDVSFFAAQRVRLRPLLSRNRLQLGNGMKVRIHGQLDVWAQNGKLSLKMGGIDPRYTLGDMLQQRDAVIRRLVASGQFDANRQTTLSPVPLRVGVITSLAGAAWHDFTGEIQHSSFGFRLSVIDCRVQGEFAVGDVSRAIATLARSSKLDVIVVIRGGGSRTDLAAFDAEPIAVAIAASRLPVMTGLGHEIDRSIADEVAYLALKTPTACGAFLAERVAAYVGELDRLWTGITAASAESLSRQTVRLEDIAQRVTIRTSSAVSLAVQRLDHAAVRLPALVRRALTDEGATIERANLRVNAEARRHLDLAEAVLTGREARVRALDPQATLARGWSITRRSDGTIVRSPADVNSGDVLTTLVAAGTIESVVQPASETG
jgi:exodeoxyribonuclease VII large subunit